MIKNLVYESEIIAKIFIADTPLKRLIGFMLHKKPHHEAILITPCNSIHTFFMKFPIDVLFISENMEIIKKLDNLSPGNVIFPQKNAKMVIESPAGLFKNIDKGMQIKIEPILPPQLPH